MSIFRQILGSPVVRFLGSFGLACILFSVLFVLTLFGTLEQQYRSLFDVRSKYFDSLFFPLSERVPIPLPGAALVLGILALNLIVGGFVRMRWSWSRAFIFVIHFGVAFLLLSGLVETLTSKKGMMTLFEGESGREFESPYEWDVSVLEQLPQGRERVFTIPFDQLPKPGRSARFRADGLPFEVHVSGFLRNARPRAAHPGTDSIEGIVLEPWPVAKEAEQNLPGVTVTLVEPGGGRREALLWARQRAPFTAKIAGRRWAVDLHRRSWPLPFSVMLRNFTHEEHPGTSIPSSFSSDVTRVEANVAQDVHISMNEPMRHKGYIFYQSGWGPQGAAPGTPLFSTFSVVENPADRGPLIAVLIIAAGLLGHLGIKLVQYIIAEAEKRS